MYNRDKNSDVSLTSKRKRECPQDTIPLELEPKSKRKCNNYNNVITAFPYSFQFFPKSSKIQSFDEFSAGAAQSKLGSNQTIQILESIKNSMSDSKNQNSNKPELTPNFGEHLKNLIEKYGPILGKKVNFTNPLPFTFFNDPLLDANTKISFEDILKPHDSEEVTITPSDEEWVNRVLNF